MIFRGGASLVRKVDFFPVFFFLTRAWENREDNFIATNSCFQKFPRYTRFCFIVREVYYEII